MGKNNSRELSFTEKVASGHWLRFDQLLRKQMSFSRKVVGAVEVTGGDGGFGLSHVLLDLIHHILLAGCELQSGDLFQVSLGHGGEFFSGVFLRSIGTTRELFDRFARPSVADNFLRRRTGFQRCGRGTG